MAEDIVLTLIGIVLLLLLSAFFSGSETALTAASRPMMHQLEQGGDRRAALVNRLRGSTDRLLGTILLGNNLVNILASALATSLLLPLFGEAGVLYATLVMTALVLVFAEVLPKTYAFHHANRVALGVAPLVNRLVAVLSPITRGIEFVVGLALRALGAGRADAQGLGPSADELRGAIELHAGEAEGGDARAMLHGILDLAQVTVGEVMIHRRNVAMIDAAEPAEAIVAQVLASPYTRLPLWRDQPDNIIGVIHAKALLRAVQGRGGNIAGLDVVALAVKPWFVPDTTTLLDQLQAFRRRREHFAIVVDEYGSLQGIVTLEDILEEIVGDIADEHDVATAGITRHDDGSVVVQGAVTIRDLNRELGWSLPDEEATTVAGLVLHEAKRIPEVGEAFVVAGLRFEVVHRQRHQIAVIRITPATEAAAAADDDAAGEAP